MHIASNGPGNTASVSNLTPLPRSCWINVSITTIDPEMKSTNIARMTNTKGDILFPFLISMSIFFLCYASLKTSSVPRRITCLTRASLRRRELFFTCPESKPAASCHCRTFFTCLSGPHRLFTSRLGRTGNTGLSVDEREEESQHAGQSRGERGLRARGNRARRATWT